MAPAVRQHPGTVTHTEHRNPVQVYKAYKFRAYPTRPQEGRSGRLLRDHCALYNAALEERREAWRMRKVSITYVSQSAQLKHIRHADPDGQGRHSFVAQQQTLRRLDRAFCEFYKRTRAGRAGYPRFKSSGRFDQVTFLSGDGAKWEPVSVGRYAYATFRAVGRIKVRQHRQVHGDIKTIQLKREGHRWYVVVVARSEPPARLTTGREVGVDVGIVRFLTTSDGEIVANPRTYAKSREVIAELERRKSRAHYGSGNRKRIRRQLAREWRRVRNRRRDFHHKTARALVDTYDVIALEKLQVRNMTRRPAPRPDGTGGHLPNGASAKAGLNKVILDVGWAQFARILAGKAEEAGRRVVLVNPAYTSINCHLCGVRCSRPQQDTVICPMHGAMDADLNGAINIASRAGLGSGQAVSA